MTQLLQVRHASLCKARGEGEGEEKERVCMERVCKPFLGSKAKHSSSKQSVQFYVRYRPK